MEADCFLAFPLLILFHLLPTFHPSFPPVSTGGSPCSCNGRLVVQCGVGSVAVALLAFVSSFPLLAAAAAIAALLLSTDWSQSLAELY